MAKEDAGGDGGELKTCAVLGGMGFIGRALVERLLRLGKWIVRVVDAAKSPELDPAESLLADAFSSGRAVYFQVDVRDRSRIVEAIEGASVVFYTDSVDSFPSDFYLCYNIIVQGAKNVVKACHECNVKHLIYNSSADVIFDNVHDICGGEESLPYSGQFWDMITDLRAQAEALILNANGIDGLLTCALRPCNVFGPGDKQFLPLLLNIAKSNWAKFIIGSGNHLSDFTYVENLAYAHICAEESLSSQMLTVSGKVFFITNLEPMRFWDFASLLLQGLGYQRPVMSLPTWVVHCIIYIIKLLHVKPVSRKIDLCASVYHIAALASHTRTFTCSQAKKHIQYSPVVSIEEAVKLTVDSYSHLTVDSSFMKHKDSAELSKVEKLLGSGEVADILLWRTEKKTFFSFLVLALLYFWFFLSGGAFISSVAKFFLLIIVLLCGHHILPLIGYGSKVPRISSSCFEISEKDMRNFFFTMKCMLDKADCLIKSLAQGKDWSVFLKVSTFLYISKVIVSQYLTAAIGLALILSFTLCYVYDQYEEKVDEIATVSYSIATKAMVLFAMKLPMPLRQFSHSLLFSQRRDLNPHACSDNRQ